VKSKKRKRLFDLWLKLWYNVILCGFFTQLRRYSALLKKVYEMTERVLRSGMGFWRGFSFIALTLGIDVEGVCVDFFGKNRDIL